MSRRYFNEISQKYFEDDNSLIGDFWRNYDIELIKAYLPAKRSIYIDLGCGNGFYSANLVSYFKHSILVDFSFSMLSNAKRLISNTNINSQVDYICMDLRKIGYLSLDSVSFFLAAGAALCYQHDALFKIIPQAYSMLESRGKIYFEIWSRHGILLASKKRSSCFKKIHKSLADIEDQELSKYFNHGKTYESAWGHSTIIKTFSTRDVLKVLQESGFQKISFFGRKAVELVLDTDSIERSIASNRKKLIKLETLLRGIPELIPICPKIIFIAEKG